MVMPRFWKLRLQVRLSSLTFGSRRCSLLLCEYCLRVFPPFFFDMPVKYFFNNVIAGAVYSQSPALSCAGDRRFCEAVRGCFASLSDLYSSKNRITQLRISSSWLSTYTQLQSEIRERATYNCPCVNGSLSNISPTRAIVCPCAL